MIYHGRNLIIKADGVAIAAAKSCDIHVKCEEIETASPSTGQWRTALIGRKSWSVTTNQLVTSIVGGFSMLGTQVALDVAISGDLGLPFDGFVDDVTTESQGYSGEPDQIVWDITNKKFLAAVRTFHITPTYYDVWSSGIGYIYPTTGKIYTCDGLNYVYANGNIQAEKLTGNANVVEWRVVAAVGNLAQGSFQFNGNGAISPASIPEI